MTVECIKFTPYEKGTLRGFADVRVPKFGMVFYSLSLHEKEGKRWINFPSKSYEKEGKKEWLPYFRFENRDHEKHFVEQVKEAINKKIQVTQGEENNESDCSFLF